jgi:hypothetical protein|tara:strand:- start:174 stop:425 length:252 start_codon:yes stop_codon:yes gene_type:complete
MSTKPMKPLPKAKQRVDLSQAETILCESCNNSLFIESYVLKRVSAIVSPTGQEGIVPIQVFACGSCGELKNLGGVADTEDLVG